MKIEKLIEVFAKLGASGLSNKFFNIVVRPVAPPTHAFSAASRTT
jgi:hypothetical protein